MNLLFISVIIIVIGALIFYSIGAIGDGARHKIAMERYCAVSLTKIDSQQQINNA